MRVVNKKDKFLRLVFLLVNRCIYYVYMKADDGTQTRDLMITNQLLYQLSYIGILLFFNRKRKSYKNYEGFASLENNFFCLTKKIIVDDCCAKD